MARRGFWILQAKRRGPGDLDAQIAELLALLTSDLDVRKAMKAKRSNPRPCWRWESVD
jgi:hypothetical protein